MEGSLKRFTDAALEAMAECLRAAVKDSPVVREAYERCQAESVDGQVSPESRGRLDAAVRDWLANNIERLEGELGLSVDVLH